MESLGEAKGSGVDSNLLLQPLSSAPGADAAAP